MITRQIRDAVDIVDLVGSYLTLRRAGANFKGLCPFHEEKTPSFTVHAAKQIFKCFGCGAGGDVFSFVQMKENVEFLEARRILADRGGISLEHDTGARRSGPGKSDLVRANDWARRLFRKNYLDPGGQAAREYVASRGISDEMAETFGIGLAVDSFDAMIRQAGISRVDLQLLVAAGLIRERTQGGYYDVFRHRLMFPITDASARVIGFGGRALGDDPAKYLNTPATTLFDKGTNLFGLDQARRAASEKGRLVVVEGYTDCIMAHQFGFTETVATLGTAMTEAHAAILRRYTNRLILLFDSDVAGQRAAEKALAVTLTVGLDVSLARVPEGKDPCDYLLSAGKTAFDAVLNDTVGALEFKWKQVAGQHNGSETGPGRRRAIEAYLNQVSAWLGNGAIDPIQTGLLVNQLSQIVSLPAEDLHRQLQQMAQRSAARQSSRQGGASGGGASAGRQPAGRAEPNVRQEALRQIVEVLLNEPQWYEDVASFFAPTEIQDPALAEVASQLVAMFNAGQEVRVDELIGKFESTAFARLITDLQARGERRGGYADVIEGALTCLESCERSRQVATLADEIRLSRRQANGQGSDGTAPDGEDERLRALAAHAKGSHFATTRARKRLLE